jgi:hypothetical protein
MIARRLVLLALAALPLVSGCSVSGHSDHDMWFAFEQRTPEATSSLSVRADRAAFLTTYGALGSGSPPREAGPAFDTELTEQEMNQLVALLDPALTASYTADSSSAEASWAAEVGYGLTVDSAAPASPTSQFVGLNLIGSGEAFDPKTKALLQFITELQLRTYERGLQIPAGGPRPSWSVPRAFE